MIVKNYLWNVLCKSLIKIESTRRCEIKEQAPQLALLYCGRTVRGSHRRCYIKNDVLKTFAIFRGKQQCWGLFLIKLLAFRLAIFLKKDSSTDISCGRLFFDCFNGSLLHGTKASRSRLYDGVRLQGPSRRSSFFSRRHLSP